MGSPAEAGSATRPPPRRGRPARCAARMHPARWVLAVLLCPGVHAAPACSEGAEGDGDACAAGDDEALLEAPRFQPCSSHYLAQRMAAQVLKDHADTLQGAGAARLAADAAALDPPGLGGGWGGAVAVPPERACPPAPAVPRRVLRARRPEQLESARLLQLAAWYRVPVFLLAVRETRTGGKASKEFVAAMEPYLGRMLPLLAEGQEFWEYATTRHRNPLNGNIMAYFPDYATRYVSPTSSFHLEVTKVNQLGLVGFLEEALAVEELQTGPLNGSHGLPDPRRPRGGMPALLDPDVLLGGGAEAESAAGGGDAAPARLPPRGAVDEALLKVAPVDQEKAAATMGWGAENGYVRVPREKELSPADFVHRYLLAGVPVVVTDAMRNWTALGRWSMRWLLKKHRKKMLRDAKMNSPDAELNENGGMWLVRTPKDRRALRRHYGVPYFMDLGSPAGGGGKGADGANSSAPVASAPKLHPEMLYYSGGRSMATPYHLDTNCAQSWSAQLEGRKQWLLWPPRGARPRLRPMAAVLEPGDLIVFYTGWVHEARNIHDSDSLSLSQFFAHPVPTSYLWQHREELLKCPVYKVCGAQWQLQTGLPFGDIDVNAIPDSVPKCLE
uniref:JmjC domain-containing protein n=1 Tax=Alexandrium monilatum TaxID=311494 RepID=A0A7S4VV02_9DINO